MAIDHGQHRIAGSPLRFKISPMKRWILLHELRLIVHRIRFPGQPMFSDASAHDLIGKTAIIGITNNDHTGRVIDHEQHHGRIVRADRTEGVVFQLASGEEFTLPPDLRSFRRARPGEYRFRSTGEVVSNPDLHTEWIRTFPA